MIRTIVYIYNQIMHIVAIAWIYVTLLMALTESSILAGILTFGLYGLIPLTLFLWIFGAPERRRRRLRRERLAEEMVDQVVSEPDRRNSCNDQ